MTGPNQFNWKVLDNALEGARAKRKHVILRVFLHYPEQPLRVPKYLIEGKIKLASLANGEKSPQYDDPVLLEALRQFIVAFGAKYDGHTSLAFVQLGLLGKWGEFHTYPDTGLLSDATKIKVIQWYQEAFQVTPLQVRNPMAAAYHAGMGLHDDSFGFSTLDGAYNGGESVDWFFWSEVSAANQQEFWRKGVMGGETRPELQGEIFEADYAAGTPYKQDFMKCVGLTHATYMFHHNAFLRDALLSGTELEHALDAHVRLGYSFIVQKVAAAKANDENEVTVDVTVQQTGVAPFYYPLQLVFKCHGTTKSIGGVESLVNKGDIKVFRFQSIPSTSRCLGNVEILLESDHVHPERPVRFDQGDDGRVSLLVPLPSQKGSQENELLKRHPWGAIIAFLTGHAQAAAVSPGPYSTVILDTGAENEELSNVSGSTTQSFSDVRIKLAVETGFPHEVFQTHRWGKRFSYTFQGYAPHSTVKVTLGFAETFVPNCSKGLRVFDISINKKPLVHGLDIFALVGCQTAYTLTEFCMVNARGKLVISFTASVDNAMVSFINVDEKV